jgi:transglutaminase-like putative cysteine protease
MRVSVLHSTVYRYSREVQLGPHAFRLRPRDDASQRLLSYELELDPQPAGRPLTLDQDGNVVINAWFNRPTQMLTVQSRFEAETLRKNAFDFVISEPGLLKIPAVYPEILRPSLAGYAAATFVPGVVHEYARSVAREAQWVTMDFLTTLTSEMFRLYNHITRDEGAPQPSDVTLSSRTGSCRDLAVLFADACRAMGLAARFVSGYEREAAGSIPAYMHAWVEVYLPGGGWRGYDPTRGLALTNTHISVAASFFPQLATPISGSFAGDAVATMETVINMEIHPSLE